MPLLTIIGYGNPLRGDDGLGWCVAERLARKVESEGRAGDLEVLALHQLTPEIAENLIGSELVIFIDANCRLEPGQISCEEITPRSPLHGPTTHHLDPAGLLAFARQLDPTCTGKALLLMVGGVSFGYGEGFSPLVFAALAELEEKLDQYIGGFFFQASSTKSPRLLPLTALFKIHSDERS